VRPLYHWDKPCRFASDNRERPCGNPADCTLIGSTVSWDARSEFQQARGMCWFRSSTEPKPSKRRARVPANHRRYDSVTLDDRRAHVPGSTYFSNANPDRPLTFITDAHVRSVVREATGTRRLTHPFLIKALLPAGGTPLRSFGPTRPGTLAPAKGSLSLCSPQLVGSLSGVFEPTSCRTGGSRRFSTHPMILSPRGIICKA
jgi:hypothetical protein